MTKHLLKSITVTAMAAIALPAISANSPYISKVYEFRPAPGQFVNEMPEYVNGDTETTMLAKVAEQICGDKNPGMISLGGFGGYVVFGFDHSVVNVAGEYDFKIYGNAFKQNGSIVGGSSEPGIVMVMHDDNGNGLPDDTWYELAGSEYSKSTTRKNYEITYYRADENKVTDPDPVNTYITDRTYIRWTSNQSDEVSGYIMRNQFHSQSYFPLWLSDSEMSFTGTCLPDNAEYDGSTYLLHAYEWGYADNLPNDETPGFKIDWAVDANGNSVQLNSIDFVKVYTAVNQYCGWIGETSTEVCGAEDLHPDAASVIGIDSDDKQFSGMAQVYSASGILLREALMESGNIDLSDLPNGIYILKTANATHKIAKMFP